MGLGVAALAVAAPAFAAAQPAGAARPPPQPPAPVLAQAQPPILNCQLIQLQFAPAVAKITNLGTTTVEPGRLINVFAIQAGPSAGSLALSAPLPPGASVSVKLAGTALLARGCVANAQ